MKIAVVAGGWHWPASFYWRMAEQASGVDLFVISHRSPELPIVREEKLDVLAHAKGPLADLDRELYYTFPTLPVLRALGWTYEEAPNTVGDWGFLNQWLERHDYRQYDCILSSHDDTYIQRNDLFEQLDGDWLILSNGTYPQAPEGYVRGSFEFFKREMLDLLGGRLDLGNVHLTREGKTDSPAGMAAISAWNDTAIPLRRFMCQNALTGRIRYLSNYYRVSPWVIEAERGFLHYTDGVPWSFEQGCKAYVRNPD